MSQEPDLTLILPVPEPAQLAAAQDRVEALGGVAYREEPHRPSGTVSYPQLQQQTAANTGRKRGPSPTMKLTGCGHNALVGLPTFGDEDPITVCLYCDAGYRMPIAQSPPEDEPLSPVEV